VDLPFWFSIGVLSIVQGAIVAVPVNRHALGPLERWRSRSWALIPAGSVLLFVVVVGAVGGESAEALTYLALIAVPLLAAVALAYLSAHARPLHALLVVPLFVLAWADGGTLLGQIAALLLTALSCVTLGLVIACVTPRRALAIGILAMALVDSALVVSNLLQQPNSVLNAAHPAASLPRLQAAMFGSAVMGYGDLFVAGALGGLLAVHASVREQRAAAVLVAALALGFDLLFFVVNELPATVPVALALVLLTCWQRIARRPARLRRELPQRVTAEGAGG
jgi:hypothetical protein